MKAFFMLPESKSELEKMDFEQKSLLWAQYSPYPYQRQSRALWYYIQCERAHATIAAKHVTMLRKYMNNPDECLNRVHKSKYHLNLAYMNPEKVNNILSGKEVYGMEEIFAIAPQHQL